ncbi:MAG: hypothetical protein ABEN55_20235, partial [Bradymonadaceae bacterium]
MARRRSSTNRWTIWVAFGISCTLHILLFVELVWLIQGPNPDEAESPDPTSRPPKKLQVKMTREPPDQTQPPEPRDKTVEQKKEEKQQKDEKDKKLQREYDRKAVVQKTNDKQLEKAEHVSAQANRVKKETRAR